MNNRIKIIIGLICSIGILNSCITNKNTDFLQNIPKEYMTVKPEEYKIIPGDLLTISVYSINDKTSDLFRAYNSSPSDNSQDVKQTSGRDLSLDEGIKPVTVYADGTINFPYLGKIYVQDKTLFEVRKELSDRLNAFSDGTSADVMLANRYFSVLGESGAQRVKMNSTKMTIFQALSTANTIGIYGDRSKVSIIRQTKDGSTMKTFDLRSKDIIDSEYYYVQPNDVLYFPQMGRKAIGAGESLASIFAVVISLASIVVYSIRLF